MKKLKKFYKNNRIYCILMLVSIFCFILMGSAVVIYFINQTTSSKYGRRLDNIDNYEVESGLKDLESFYKEQEKVKNCSVRLQGKIIYISVEVEEKVSNEDIQSIATTSLEKLNDEQKSYYDIQFIFKRDNSTPYLGSKSSTNTVISWANYNTDIDDDSSSKK